MPRSASTSLTRPSCDLLTRMRTRRSPHSQFDDGLRALKFYLVRVLSPSPPHRQLTSILPSRSRRDRASRTRPSSARRPCSRSSTLSPVRPREPSCPLPSHPRALTALRRSRRAVDLATHFSDELNTINPEVLREFFSIADLEKQGASLQKHVVKDYKRHLYTALRASSFRPFLPSLPPATDQRRRRALLNSRRDRQHAARARVAVPVAHVPPDPAAHLPRPQVPHVVEVCVPPLFRVPQRGLSRD